MPDLLRSLENYKKMHEGTAKQRGCETELKNARTLTAARRILFGEKKKQYVKYKTPGSNK